MTTERDQGRLRETGFIYLFLLLYGFFTTIIGTTLTRLMDEFGLQLSQGGVFIALQSIGCFLGIFISGALLDRFGKRALLPISFGSFALAVVVVSCANSLGLYLVLLLLAGIAGTTVDVITNASIGGLHVTNRGFFMNLLHCSFGVGSFFGPMYAGWILERFDEWRLSYLFLGVTGLVVLVAYRVARTRDDPFPVVRPDVHLTGEKSVVGFRDVLSGKVLLCCLLLFLYCGHQSGMNNWLPTFAGAALRVDTIGSGTAVSAFWLGLIFGRLGCSVITRYIGEKALIIAGFLLGGGSLLPGVLLGNAFGIYGGAVGAGLFAGATVPMVLTLAYTWYPTAQGKVSTVLFFAITGSAIVVPWCMGVVSGWYGLTAAMALNACLLILGGFAATALPCGGVIRN